MSCFHPLRAWRIYDEDTGKFFISFKQEKEGTPYLLPCGQCLGCRLDHAKMWAIRCMHEAQMHEDNCFITLTYADDFLPSDRSLHVEDLQKFFKRLRKRFGDKQVRYYACGEYGDKHGPPHFHAILFGVDFPDKKFWFRTPHGDRVYTSEILQKLWPDGISCIGACTLESCGYVARYVVKKFKGRNADKHYQELGITPEFVVMSRRPGIAREWFEKYKSDVFPNDFVVTRDGKKVKPPRYYENLLKELDEKLYYRVGINREDKQFKKVTDHPDFDIYFDDNFIDLNKKLKVKDVIVSKRAKKLKRSLENE